MESKSTSITYSFSTLAIGTREADPRRLEDLRDCNELLHQLLRQEAEQTKHNLHADLSDLIDLHIRTRSKFNGRQPQMYKCPVSSIAGDKNIQQLLRSIEGDLSLEDFICQDNRFIADVSVTVVSVRFLTPFQGPASHRVFGSFKCNCGKKWNSAATWKDKSQRCQKCDQPSTNPGITFVFPYQQHVLKTSEHLVTGEEEKRPHDRERCQKCRDKGEICLPHIYKDARLY